MVTLLVQVLAFLRQLLVAAYFGVGRGIDAYVMIYTVATVLVFTFAGIFDSIAVPHLVRTRERDGAEAAFALARSIFRLSLLLGVGMSLVFLIAVPTFAPIFATGFSPEERLGLTQLSWYFLPWTLVCVPYYAAAARYKMEWRFNRVFIAEIVVVVVSIAVLALQHGHIRALPIAYASGYAAGLLLLAVGLLSWRRSGSVATPSIRGVLRNIGEMFLANQSNSLTSIVDRHIQSFLAPGGIGAVNYSSQIIGSISTLLTFREIYMVPLTREVDRTERLERLISGLLLMAIPLVGFVACFAPELVTVLLQRGRFDAAATALTTQALRIGAFGLVASTVFLPLLRMFQILDRIRLTHLLFLLTALEYAVLGYLFVVALGLGVRGVALMQVTCGVPNTIVAIYLLTRCGIRLDWRQMLHYFLLASLVSGAACFVALVAVSGLGNAWARISIGGATYGMVILISYFFTRSQWRSIMLGVQGKHTL
jgi:putative peptidoglycan lipid II flippase